MKNNGVDHWSTIILRLQVIIQLLRINILLITFTAYRVPAYKLENNWADFKRHLYHAGTHNKIVASAKWTVKLKIELNYSIHKYRNFVKTADVLAGIYAELSWDHLQYTWVALLHFQLARPCHDNLPALPALKLCASIS